MLRIVSPPEIEKETNELLDAWMSIPEEQSPEWEDFLEKNCSDRMKEYLEEVRKIKAELEPGTYV